MDAMACWQNSYLGNRELEVLLRDVLPPLAKRIHAGLRADTPHLSPGTLPHLFRERAQVDTTLQRHLGHKG